MALAVELAYAALLLLASLALLWSAWPAWLKGALVVSVTSLYFVGSHAVHAVRGLPSSDALPARFQMVAALVDEPAADHPGALYLWVNELRDEDRAEVEPRLYRVRYSPQLARDVEDGTKRGRGDQQRMGGSAEPKPGAGSGFLGLRPGNDEQEIRLGELPAPRLPVK